MSDLLSLKWENHHSEFFSIFGSLKKQSVFSDVTIMCGGKMFAAHKLVLAASSPYFQKMLVKQPLCGHLQPLMIVLEDVDYNHFERLLEYMYAGETAVEQSLLPQFMKTATRLQIRGFAGSTSTSNHKNKSSGANGKRNYEEISQDASNVNSDIILNCNSNKVDNCNDTNKRQTHKHKQMLDNTAKGLIIDGDSKTNDTAYDLDCTDIHASLNSSEDIEYETIHFLPPKRPRLESTGKDVTNVNKSSASCISTNASTDEMLSVKQEQPEQVTLHDQEDLDDEEIDQLDDMKIWSIPFGEWNELSHQQDNVTSQNKNKKCNSQYSKITLNSGSLKDKTMGQCSNNSVLDQIIVKLDFLTEFVQKMNTNIQLQWRTLKRQKTTPRNIPTVVPTASIGVEMETLLENEFMISPAASASRSTLIKKPVPIPEILENIVDRYRLCHYLAAAETAKDWRKSVRQLIECFSPAGELQGEFRQVMTNFITEYVNSYKDPEISIKEIREIVRQKYKESKKKYLAAANISEYASLNNTSEDATQDDVSDTVLTNEVDA